MINKNGLTLKIFSSGSTEIVDANFIRRAEQINFSTVYPGGIFEAASFFVPCDPTGYLPIQHAQRIMIKNGLVTVWEGFITSIALVVTPERKGIDVQATGYWGLAFHRYKYARWIDRRFQSDIFGVWYYGISNVGPAPKFEIDQTDHIQIRPKQVQMAYGDTIYVSYQTNGASNVKRIKFDYAFSHYIEDNPIRAKKFTQIGGTYTANLPNLIDGNAVTTQAVALANNDLLYIGLPIDKADGITGFRFAFSGANVNNNAATLELEYFTNGHTWQSIAITDGTASGGACWAQDGVVSFTAIDGLHWIDVNGSQEFIYFRFGASAALDSVTIEDIYVQRSQSWTMLLYDVTNLAVLWQVSAAGTGSQDITLGTSSAWLAFGLAADAAQEVVGDGVYAEVTNLVCVAEAWDGDANITVSTLLQDMTHSLGAPFADDYTYIAANTYDMLTTGFVSDNFDTALGDDMRYVGSFSATDEPYSVGVLESDALSGTNTSAVIYYEKIAALTDYDYAVRLGEENLSGFELVTSSDLDTLINQVYVTFTNINDLTQWANSGNYAGLVDSTSATKYMSRTLVVNSSEASTSTLAARFGAPYIKAKKDLAYYMRAPLQLSGTIRRKDGTRVPVSMLRAGKRIKIENFLNDVGDALNSGLIFLISGTNYDDASGILMVTSNISDDLGLQISRIGGAEAGVKGTRG